MILMHLHTFLKSEHTKFSKNFTTTQVCLFILIGFYAQSPNFNET